MHNTLNPAIGEKYWNHNNAYQRDRYPLTGEDTREVRYDWEQLAARRSIPAPHEVGDGPFVLDMEAYEAIHVAPHRISQREHPDHTAIAGTVELSENGGDVHGTMSFTAYLKTGAGQADSRRPIMFVRNGGPVSATTLWNALELTAPHGVTHMPNDEHTPYPLLTQRETTPFEDTDIVHIDAMGVGWGQPHTDKDRLHYAGIENDARVFAAVIEWFTNTYDQADNPIFYMGSSYAGRAGLSIANYLDARDKNLAGLALVSPSYEGFTTHHHPGDPRRHIANIAVYAATKEYHGWQRPPSPDYLRAVYDDASYFAWTEYADFFLKPRVNSRSKQSLARTLAKQIGINADTILQHNHLVEPRDFTTSFLGLCGLRLSSLDTRLTYSLYHKTQPDVALNNWKPHYTALAIDYFREHFGYVPEDGNTYVSHANLAPQWQEASRGELYTGRVALMHLLQRRPDLPIVETHGMFDLLTPSQAQFWDKLSPPEYVTDQPRSVDLHYGDIRQPLVKPGVNVFTLPSGHQPGAEVYSRKRVAAILKALVSTDE